jgi:dTDP-glucose 4,6-dehydratase
LSNCAKVGSRTYWRERADDGRPFRFLHVSTDEVFGSLGATGAFLEESAYRPNSPYSATKAAADHLVRAWHRTCGLPVVITNCSNNYGPHQYPEKLIPLLIAKGLAGEAMPIYGAGTNIRDWLYVEDHVRGLRLALEKGRDGESYNFGGGAELTNMAVAESVCAILDDLHPGGTPHRDLISFVEDRPGHDKRYAIDAAKAEAELGWAPQESFETGLRRTVDWYLENQDWCAAVLAGTYDGGRLGLAGTAAS